MTDTIYRPLGSHVSRRRFLGTAAGAAAVAVITPSSLAAQDINWRLGVRYFSGGASYRPSFATMFLDPMFLQIDVGPLELGVSTSPTISTRKAAAAVGGAGRGQGAAAAPGAPARPLSRGVAAAPAPGRPAPGGLGTPGYANAPLNASDVPPDMPIIPSVGVRAGISTLTRQTFSVVVLNDQTEWIANSRQSIEDAFNSGDELVGTVVFHNALGDNQTWPLWYQDITGGLLVLNDHDGMKKTTVTPSATFDVRPVGTHPIVQDIPAFKVTGEDAYKGMWQSPTITPLLEATGSATDRIVAWVGPNPAKGRVVVIQPGTSSETHRNPAFRKLVRNAILWAGHRLE